MGRRAAWLTAAGVTAAVAFWRRRAARQRERVDLYFVDGSMIALSEDSEEARRLLPLAHEVLAAAR